MQLVPLEFKKFRDTQRHASTYGVSKQKITIPPFNQMEPQSMPHQFYINVGKRMFLGLQIGVIACHLRPLNIVFLICINPTNSKFKEKKKKEKERACFDSELSTVKLMPSFTLYSCREAILRQTQLEFEIYKFMSLNWISRIRPIILIIPNFRL